MLQENVELLQKAIAGYFAPDSGAVPGWIRQSATSPATAMASPSGVAHPKATPRHAKPRGCRSRRLTMLWRAPSQLGGLRFPKSGPRTVLFLLAGSTVSIRQPGLPTDIAKGTDVRTAVSAVQLSTPAVRGRVPHSFRPFPVAGYCVGNVAGGRRAAAPPPCLECFAGLRVQTGIRCLLDALPANAESADASDERGTHRGTHPSPLAFSVPRRGAGVVERGGLENR